MECLTNIALQSILTFTVSTEKVQPYFVESVMSRSSLSDDSGVYIQSLYGSTIAYFSWLFDFDV